MYSERIQYAIDNFIMDQYFLPMNTSYQLDEKKDSGKSSLQVTISNENLCIYDFDSKKKCNFLRPDGRLGMQKSVDHILFEKIVDVWRLHLIEMKSSVGCNTWLDSIKPKVRTSYLTSLAIADFLGIKISDVIAYTTYETDKFSDERNKTNPKAMIPLLGKAARNPQKDEWEQDKMFLEMGCEVSIPHRRIKMERNPETNVLEGELII